MLSRLNKRFITNAPLSLHRWIKKSPVHFQHKVLIQSSFSTIKTTTPLQDVGLFSLPNLHKPQDFLSLANVAMGDCNSLREIIRNSLETSNLSPRETLHVLDDISNTICSVIDASELCRSVHSSPQWRQAASTAFQMLSEYIAELNADVSLYESLVPITSNPTIMLSLSEEERRMAFMLQKEFESNAIHLSDEGRAEVQQLNGFVVQLESMFTENLVHHKSFDVQQPLTDDVYRTIPKHIIQQNITQSNSSNDSVTLTTEPHIANSLLKYSSSSSLRKEVYMEQNTVCPQNLEVLDALIKQRHEMAVKMGYPSYGHYFLSDKMASTPENVMNFLSDVKHASKDRYNRDLEMLSSVKSQLEGTNEPIQPWDLIYYTGITKNHLFEGQDDAGDGSLSGYFTVEQSIEGMKELVKRLFGIVMQESALGANERWDIEENPDSASNGIRKFEFFEEVDGNGLGTMYLDLHPRAGKYTHAAHFTVRCGCELREASTIGQTNYQLPIVALVCNVSPPASNTAGGISILSHSEVETVFHEFGHALHR